MNDKKYIISGAIIILIIAIGGAIYYFTPGMMNDVFSYASDPTIVASNGDISSSTDDIIPSSTSDDDVDQDDPSVATSLPPVSHKKISTKVNNVPLPNVRDESASDASMNIAKTISDTSVATSVVDLSPSLCSFPVISSSSRSRKIIFNEVAWMGSPSSSNAEWMEIKNISGNDIDMSGWEIMNISQKIKIIIPSSDTLANNGLLLLTRNSSGTGISYSGNLANAGDVLAIMDPQCDVSDILDASSGWPAGNNTTKQTLERDADTIGWHTSALPGGTPGQENSFVSPPIPKIIVSSNNGAAQIPSAIPDTTNDTSTPASSTPTSTQDLVPASSTDIDSPPNASSSIQSSSSIASSGHVLIVAVQIAGVSSMNDFVKLYNPTSASIDISGWKLHKRSQTGTEYSLKEMPAGSLIGPAEYFIWANSIGGFSDTVSASVSSTETLSADNSVGLLDATGALIDSLAWGTGTGQFGEGSAYPTDPTNGELLTRRSSGGIFVNTQNNANDFSLQ